MLRYLLLITMGVWAPGLLLGQTADSTKTCVKKDSLSQGVSVPAPLKNGVQSLGNKMSPVKQVDQISNAAKNKVKQAGDAFSKSLDKVNRKPVTMNLTLQDAVRYQPAPVISGIIPTSKQANVFSVQGTIQAFGIPLNVNYSNDQAAIAGVNSMNNLLKLDFNPAQFSGMFKSDLQQYYDLRRNSFGGLDLAGYTRKTVLDQLKTQQTAVAGKLQNPGLTQYLSNPASMTALLSLNEEQIRQKLTEVAQSEAKQVNPVKELNNINSVNPAGSITGTVEKTTQQEIKGKLPVNLRSINTADPLAGLTGMARKQAEDKLKAETQAMTGILSNPDVKKYLNDPRNLQQLKGMNQQQIVQKLSALTAQKQSTNPAQTMVNADLLNLVPELNLSAYINKAMSAYSAANDETLKKLAQQIAGPGEGTAAIGTVQNQQLNATIVSGKTPGALPIQSKQEIDSIAHTIAGIKDKLQKSGTDVSKVLQIQKMLDSGNGSLPSTEQASNMLARKPGSGIQALFSNVQALKIGSFGNQVPGGVQNQDVFMSGTHITYKLGTIPVTAGYGSSGDINSIKDAAYQSSVYSSPKDMTYLGAQIKRGVFGNVKIAMVSSFGATNNNGIGGLPAQSSNNVAFTVSKNMNMGKLGTVDVDVSKSTTLYNNNYQIGSDIILAQKSGVNINSANDLFDAVEFGLNHHLDIRQLDMSDNLYFNYSGMGYQNPGNNGYGGARMKIGGNIKKAFNKNKLTLNLRTDISNMPISYTTSDKWKNYQVQLDSRYVVNKKFNLSFKYTANGTGKEVDNITTPVYSFQKTQVDGNINYKIGKNFTVSHFSIGKQNYNNTNAIAATTTGMPAGLTAASGSLLTLSYTQSTVINRNSLTASLFYNKELSAYSLIGNMLNGDVSYQYQLLGKLSLSSGLTYLNNGGIASQVGVRQTLQLFSGKYFDMDTYVDLRKNLITPLYPDLYSACRTELALKYHLSH